VSLADVATMVATDADERIDGLAREGDGILLMDVDSPETQAAAGRQLWRLKGKGDAFVAGSSGVEYALLNAWREQGLIGPKPDFQQPGKVERLAVVSGSVSPTTERQIRWATTEGFEGIAVDPLELIGENAERALEMAANAGAASLKEGRSVILHTALGPSADRGGDIDRIPGARHRLGQALGILLRRLIEQEGLGRAVIAGGDTSSHALQELRVDALTTLLPLPQTPGSPLCTAHGSHAPTNGLQIALKGGQVGTDDYFAQIRDGRGS
jgi:uncharacterized protein YgbK (DUF1537 family)